MIQNEENNYCIGYGDWVVIKGGDQMKSLSVRLGVIFIGLIIFSYAEVCKAQCAWVLWKHVDNNVSGQRSWELIKAFTEHKQCIQILSRKGRSVKVFRI